MSLSSALSTAVSGLSAQSLALSAISQNIANSSTTGYKTRETIFSAMVTGALNSGNAVSGVAANSSQAMLVQGLIAAAADTTNLAIDGSGFFVVSDGAANRPSEYVYTRNGSFSTNGEGYLVNSEGYLLLGYATNAEGDILSANANDLSGLEPISVQSISGAAAGTTTVSMTANLPADAAIGDAFTSTIEVIDGVGVSHTVAQTWTKTAPNEWRLDLADPYATDNPGAPSGAISPSSFAIGFNGDGVLSSIDPSGAAFTMSGLSSGANASTITLDLGAAGATDGLTQFAASSTSPDIEITNVDQDGARYGQLSSISIDDGGLVTANFDNGISRAIYQIPLATFANPGGLTQIGGTVYRASLGAGTMNISMPTEGAAGAIQAAALEGSTTDTATEFNKMIIAQQAYSAAAQVISTCDDMYTTLLTAIR